MMNEKAVDDAIRVLNEALEADGEAINKLMAVEIPINSKLADHPTVQVGAMVEGGPCVVRCMGLINGLFGVDERNYGFISMIVGDDRKIKKFQRTELKKE